MPGIQFKPDYVPDWGRRAIRLALALFFFTRLGHTLFLMPEHLRAEWGDELRQSCNWAGASCAVVAASPLIGKVAQLSYERTLGTVAGGLLGFLAYDYGVGYLPDEVDAWFLSLSAAAVGALSCWLSYKYKLDASMRLFVITFLIVTVGNNPERGALWVALLRTGGIIAGVLTLMMLTVIILPKSATVESLREVKRSLKSLVELNKLVLDSIQLRLDQGSTAKPPAVAPGTAAAAATSGPQLAGSVASTAAVRQEDTGGGGARRSDQQQPGWWRWHRKPRADGYLPLKSEEAMEEGHQQQQQQQQAQQRQQQQAVQQQNGSGAAAGSASIAEQWDKYEAECEKVLTDVYQSMFKVKEQIELSRNELYVWHFYGHYLFLPTLPGGFLSKWLTSRRWTLLASDMETVATCIRRMARLLWTVHLDCDEAFDNELMRQLNAMCQGGLVQGLSTSLASALTALAEAFPSQRTIRMDGLKAFSNAVHQLFAVSEAQRNELIALMARFKAHRPLRQLQRTSTASLSAAPSHVPSINNSSPRHAPLHVGNTGARGSPGPGSSPLSRAAMNAAAGASWSSSLDEQPRGLSAVFARAATAAVAASRLSKAAAGANGGHQGLPRAADQAGAAQQQQGQQQKGEQQGKGEQQQQDRQHQQGQQQQQQQQGRQQQQQGEQQGVASNPRLDLSVAAAAAVAALEAERILRRAFSASEQEVEACATAAAQVNRQPDTAETLSGSPPRLPREPPVDCSQLLQTTDVPAPPAPPAAGEAPAAAAMHQHDASAPAQAAAVGDDADFAAAVSNPLLIPATDNDYVTQVRWHTFQFLMDELEEELEELYLAVSAVLEKLPYAV